MLNLLTEIFSYDFLTRAFLAGTLISIVAALVGVTLVLKKSAMIGDGLSHTALSAFTIATALGFTPLWFSLPVVIITSFVILKLSTNRKFRGDAWIAVLAAGSLAISTLTASLTTGINVDFTSFLFGSILAVSTQEIILSLIVAIVCILLYLFSFNRIFAITFDEEFARSIGIKTNLYSAIFSIICSVIIVLGMRLLGTLLISSLLIFPTLTAMQLNRTFRGVVFSSVVISLLAFAIGFVLSYALNAPTGASIVVVNLIFLLFAFISRQLLHKA